MGNCAGHFQEQNGDRNVNNKGQVYQVSVENESCIRKLTTDYACYVLPRNTVFSLPVS